MHLPAGVAGRFFGRVAPPNSRGCRLWRGATSAGKGGVRYGTVSIGGTTHKAHHVAFVLGGGVLLPGDVIRHECDTPLCMTYAHLKRGTHKDNMNDMKERGRAARGERHGRSKLSDSERSSIYLAWLQGMQTTEGIGLAFGVSAATVRRVVRKIARA